LKYFGLPISVSIIQLLDLPHLENYAAEELNLAIAELKEEQEKN
jgi:hypothetical protein